MLNIKNTLSRADEFTIQQIIGVQTVKILSLLNETPAYNSEFKKLILKLHTPEKILLDKKLRNIIIDLLKEPEIKYLARCLEIYDGNLSLPQLYEKVKNTNFKRGSKNEINLFLSFDLQPLKEENDKDVISVTEPLGQYSLFKHQRTAARRIKSIFLDLHNRVLLHMPTGSGKTRTAMNIVSDYLRANEPSVVIWLAATEELCDQAAEEFEKAWSFLGDREVKVHRFWGGREIQVEDIRDGLIVAGLPKMVSRSKGTDGRKFIAQLASRISFIIIDEAHQAIAPMYKFVLDMLFDLGNTKKLLGLSATPGRTWADQEADKQLATFFSRKKVRLEVEGYENPVDYLTDAGYLAKVNFKPLIYEDSTLSEKEKIDIQTYKEIPKSLLNKFAEDEKRNLVIINEAIRLSQSHKRIILFAPSVESSNMISFILESQGLHSRSLTGETPNLLRREIIDDFKNDEATPKIICNYGVLTTGFDAPKTSAAIIGRPTISLVLYSQMIGRAIRGKNAGGNEEAEIVTIIDQDLPGFRSVAEAFLNWEDVWE